MVGNASRFKREPSLVSMCVSEKAGREELQEREGKAKMSKEDRTKEKGWRGSYKICIAIWQLLP